MRKSGCRTIFHIYLIFFFALLGTLLAAAGLFFLMVTVPLPGGSAVRSDWPKTFTENFGEQIIFIDGTPRIRQSATVLLDENGIGLQILNPAGEEVFSYRKPKQQTETYSGADLLRLYQTGRTEEDRTTAFAGTASGDGGSCLYILFFPVNISKITMYLNGTRFSGGKGIILTVLGVLCLIVITAGVFYGYLTARAIKQLTVSIRDISLRSYLPSENNGVFHDLYDSLNTLDAEIKTGDRLKAQTEKMREEWIANITHDLKTPLSPIKGYAEILQEDGAKSKEQCMRYAAIIQKNAAYMEALIDDLKLTYRLESGMVPMRREEQNLARFLKELVIDILNTPEYESRTVHYECTGECISFSFDRTLFTRAFQNIIINSFVHGEDNTEVTLRVLASDGRLKIHITDNGSGMSPEAAEHLFDRYYRGTNTGQKPEGSGLGLAIAKGIIELHGGTISVSSIPAAGTTFQIEFSLY